MFKHAVKVTTANVEHLLHRGYTLEDALELALSLVEMPVWVATQVKLVVTNKFMEVM